MERSHMLLFVGIIFVIRGLQSFEDHNLLISYEIVYYNKKSDEQNDAIK